MACLWQDPEKVRSRRFRPRRRRTRATLFDIARVGMLQSQMRENFHALLEVIGEARETESISGYERIQ